MKDGRTHLAHKAEHAVDLDTGAIVAVTLQAADLGDTTTINETLADAGLAVADLIDREAELHTEEEPKVNVDGLKNLLQIRATIAAKLLSESRNWKFALTSRKRNSPASDTGRASRANSRPFIKTVNGCAASMERSC